eukprot:1193713-Prorocentrum_minimum.AAC.2
MSVLYSTAAKTSARLAAFANLETKPEDGILRNYVGSEQCRFLPVRDHSEQQLSDNHMHICLCVCVFICGGCGYRAGPEEEFSDEDDEEVAKKPSNKGVAKKVSKPEAGSIMKFVRKCAPVCHGIKLPEKISKKPSKKVKGGGTKRNSRVVESDEDSEENAFTRPKRTASRGQSKPEPRRSGRSTRATGSMSLDVIADDEDDSEEEQEEEEESEQEGVDQSDDEVTKIVKNQLKPDADELFQDFSFKGKEGKKESKKPPAKPKVSENKRVVKKTKLVESRKPVKKTEKPLKPKRDGERRSEVRKYVEVTSIVETYGLKKSATAVEPDYTNTLRQHGRKLHLGQAFFAHPPQLPL